MTTTPRLTPRERVAVVVVLLLCLTTAVGTAAYALTRAPDLAGPALVGAAAGGPPTVSTATATAPTTTTAADTTTTATTDTTDSPATASPATARPSADASARPTRSPTPKPRTTAKAKQKVVIPATASLAYTRNTGSATSSGSGRVIRFDVRVQKGLPYDVDEVAAQIAATLNDPHSWRADGRQRFRLVSAGDDAELHAYLVTPGTTDRLCAPLRTRGKVSCRHGDKVVLNAQRWAFAVPEFSGRVPLYRQYLVNHEFGHYLGYGHVGCPAKGRLAPVMMQQTKGLDGCKANAWPYPKKR